MTVAPNELLASRGACETLGDALVAGAAGAVCSAAPSTVWTVATGGSLLDGALAAGSILMPGEHRTSRLLVASVPVHVALSLGWGGILAAALPRRATVPAAVAGALAIAALDLEVIARRFPRIRALPQGRQWADHVAYGLAVGLVVRRRRAARAGSEPLVALVGLRPTDSTRPLPGRPSPARATTARARPGGSRMPRGRRPP